MRTHPPTPGDLPITDDRRSAAPVDMGERSHLDEHGRPRIIERRFVVADEEAGLRVDHFLKKKISRLSRTRLQRIARTQLTRNGAAGIKPSATVAAGDVLVLRREARAEPPCPRTFDVLHEDPRVLVVSKPAGLPVHASAKFYFNTLTRVLGERYPDEVTQICHRLDRETSGALVVARDRDAARILKAAFADKRVRKSYRAIVYGVPGWSERRVDMPLGLVSGEGELNVRMEVRDRDSQPAVTEMRVVERTGHHALLECRPITGRQHQIRAHLAAIGHPIVGDKLYAHGDEAFRRYCDLGMTPELEALFVLPRQALHAHSIAVPHPGGDRELSVSAPLSPDLIEFMARSHQRG